MSEQAPPDEPLTASEARLLALLVLLRGDGAHDDPALRATLMRTLRWQRTLRQAARAVGDLALALADGLALVAGIRTSGTRRRG